MAEVKALEKKHAAMTIEREEEIASYHKLRQQLHGLEKEMQRYLQKPQYILPFLQPGRLINVVHPAARPSARVSVAQHVTEIICLGGNTYCATA